MSTLPTTPGSIDVQLLRNANLKNEEIVELVAFISQAESIDPYREHLQILLDKYDMTLEMRTLPIEVISLREKFNLRSLRNFYRGIETEGYYSLILALINAYQDDKNAAVYADLIKQIFEPDLGPEFVREMLDFMQNSEMDGTGIHALDKYFTNILREIANFAPIPDYIFESTIEVENLLRLKESPVSADLPNDYIADYLLTRLNNYLVLEGVGELDGLTINEIQIGDDPDATREYAKEVVIEKLEKMSAMQREEFLNLFKVDPEDVDEVRADREVFRVYGPVNSYYDTNFANLRDQNGELDVNKIYGGARMFTDMQLEYDYEADLPIDDWFTGYCQECDLRIRAYFHAVREPNLTGGWMGCFCSWDCVRKKIARDTEADPDLYNMYVVRVTLTREVEKDMNEIGIANRDYEYSDEEEAPAEAALVLPPNVPPPGLQ